MVHGLAYTHLLLFPCGGEIAARNYDPSWEIGIYSFGYIYAPRLLQTWIMSTHYDHTGFSNLMKLEPMARSALDRSSTKFGVILIASVFFLFFSWASIDYHNTGRYLDGKHDLHSDAAGYYIYLPGVFHYGMRGSSVDPDVLVSSGSGFEVDNVSDRILTRYTYGTALLELPFYLVAEIIEGYGVADQMSKTHHAAIEVSGVFYFTLGLLLIAFGLIRLGASFNFVTVLTLLCIAFGTNTFFYAYVEPGYSHVYSFFLVALSLYLVLNANGKGLRTVELALLAASNALVMVIRPTDLIAVFALYALLFIRSPDLIRSKRLWFAQVLAGLLFAFPQLLYWRFVHGDWLVYSYGDEGFTNWASPKILEVLASPKNGLFPHAPAFVLLPFALIVMIKLHGRMGWAVLSMFALVLYSCASWHSWYFGCSYGMRPLVQYTPFLAVCLWVMFDQIRKKRPAIWFGMVPLIVLLCFMNYRFMMYKEVCYPGSEWNWKYYGRELTETFFGDLPKENYR